MVVDHQPSVVGTAPWGREPNAQRPTTSPQMESPALVSGGGGHGSSRKPSSVSRALRHGRWSSVWDGGRPTPQAAYPRLTVAGVVGAGRTSPLIWPCSDRGLPCHPCYQGCGGLLPHRFTLACVRCLRSGPSAVCFLLPCPSPRGAQALPGDLPCGARTFLDGVSPTATIALGPCLEDNCVRRER